jgi:dipeptidyl aminopeptidase/acylaminoacyl peptidase
MRCVKWIFASAVFMAAGASSANNQIPIEAFIKPENIELGSFQVSPTGEFFSVIVPSEDRSSLVIYDRASNKPTANVALKEGQFVSSYNWVGDKRVVLSLAMRNGRKERPTATGDLWGIDADGKNGRYLFSETELYAAAFVIEPAVDAEGDILVGLQPWQYTGVTPYIHMAKLDVMTGRLKPFAARIPIRDVDVVLTDKAGKARIVMGTLDSGHTQLFHRTREGADWVMINDETETKREISPLSFTNAGNSIFARVSEAKKASYLIRIDLDTGKETVIYAPKRASIGGIQQTADGQDAYAVYDFDVDPRGGLATFNGKLPEARLSDELAELFPGQSAIIQNFSRDGRFASVLVSSDQNPGQYYVHDRDTKKLHKSGSVRPAITPSQMAVMEPLEFTARDGLKIPAWLTMPKNPAGKLPMVVLPHGGPYSVVDRWGFDEEVQLLASRGYAVLQINFRGSGGYGTDFVDAGTLEWGGKMQHDLTDGTRAVIEKFNIDPARVCMYGISYGAYAALMAVATEPGIYRCAIGFSGVYDLALMPKQGDIRNTAYGRNYLGTILLDDKQWLKDRSPTELAGKIKAPVLLIHGGRDARTPPKHAETMRSALIKAGNEPGWLYQPLEGHGFFNPQNRIAAYQAILDFLDKHIGPQAKP